MLLSTISPQAAIFFMVVVSFVGYFILRYFTGSEIKQPFDDPSDWGRN